jgi:hypothetical protein
MPMDKANKWTITITRIGTKPAEIIEKIEFIAYSQLEAENKVSDVWNQWPANQPELYRAKLRNPSGDLVLTID